MTTNTEHRTHISVHYELGLDFMGQDIHVLLCVYVIHQFVNLDMRLPEYDMIFTPRSV